MATKFKCCKKDMNNYICIACQHIFHSSCLARMKNVKKLHEHYIYCSEGCVKNEKYKKDEMDILVLELEKNKRSLSEKDITMTELEFRATEEIEEMKNAIGELQTKNKEKDSFIKKLQKQIKDFEDEVFEEEQKFEARQMEQKRHVEKLLKEITEMKQQNRTLSEEIRKNKDEHKLLTNKLKILQEIRDEMTISIETLEAENDMYKNKNELSDLCEKSKTKNNVPNNIKTSSNRQLKVLPATKTDRPKIRIIAQALGKNLGEGLNNLLGDTHSVLSVIKPGATDCELLNDAISEVKNFTLKDTLIFWPCVANKTFIQNLLMPFKNVKIIIITQPYQKTNYKNINNLIYYNNLELKKEACKVGKGAYVLECNNVLRRDNYCGRGKSLTKVGKYYICKTIKDVITNYAKTEGIKESQDKPTETYFSENTVINKSFYTKTRISECQNIDRSLWEEMQETKNEDQTLDSSILNIINVNPYTKTNFQKTPTKNTQA